VVYHYDQYPYGAMGPVKFLWQYVEEQDQPSTSASNTSEMCRHMWIWVHPAMYMDFIKEIKIAIGVLLELDASQLSGEVISKLSEQVVEERSLTESQMYHKQMRKKWKAMKMYKEEEADYLKNTARKKPMRYQDIFSMDLREFKQSEVHEPETFSSGAVTVRSLKDSMCRFHLTGPLSNEILRETLQVSNVLQQSDPQTETKTISPNTTYVGEDISVRAQDSDPQVTVNPWWKQFYSDARCLNRHKEQEALWNSIKSTESPAELPPSCVLGLTVRDPRKFLPRKKSMIQHQNKGYCLIYLYIQSMGW
jgi:hypothetical protein